MIMCALFGHALTSAGEEKLVHHAGLKCVVTAGLRTPTNDVQASYGTNLV